MTPVAVTSVAMTSSLGLDSATACAAARAGLVRMSEINTLNYALDPTFGQEGPDGPPLLVGHLLPIVGAGSTGIAKLLALSRPALQQLLQTAALTCEQWPRTALLINVADAYFQSNFAVPDESAAEEPAPYSQLWETVARQMPERLCVEFSLPIAKQLRSVLLGGRIGIADLLRHAAQLIAQGRVDRCIVGTVESCVEPNAIAAYAAAGVLKCGANPAGFIPGEAAAFFVLERAQAAATRPGAFIVSAISDATDATYSDTNEVPRGRALSACISAVLPKRADGHQPFLIIADLNGTEVRAADWGYTLVQLRARLGSLDFETWLPATSFGETGAAAGGVAFCMAFHATQRRYLPGAFAVVALSGEDGRRVALCLEPLQTMS